MTHESNNIVCIIGMHRSGTSMIARLLHQCGLYLGPDKLLLGPSEGNLLGHFEHQGFLELHEALLAHLGGSAFVPPPLTRGWEQAPSLSPFIAKARDLVQTFRDYSPWGWKEPRTTLLLPFWKALIPNLRFIICIRNPVEVALSVVSRRIGSFEKGIWLWNEYTRAALRDTENSVRRIVFYSDFFREGTSEVLKLVQFCGLTGSGASAIIDDGVSPELRHHEFRADHLLNHQRVLPEPKLLYLGLRMLVSEQSGRASAQAETDATTDNGIRALLAVLQASHGTDKQAETQSALILKDVQIENLEANLAELKEENKRNLLELKDIRSTLFWQLFMKLERAKGRVFPLKTRRRTAYNWCLKKLKSIFTAM